MSSKPLQVLRHLSSSMNPVPVDELAEPLGPVTSPDARCAGSPADETAVALAQPSSVTRLVFLDEPCAGLDPQAREKSSTASSRPGDRGVAVVLTTHDLAEAEELSDEVVVIDRGRIIAQGAPEDLRSASAGSRSLTIRLDSPVPADLSDRLAKLGPASAQGSLITIDGAPTSEQIAAACTAIAEAGLQITDIGMQRQSLSDVFFELTGRPLR